MNPIGEPFLPHLTMLRLGQLLYLMLPVYFANMAPPFIRYWHGWNRPISMRYLGSHKTVVGALAGVAMAIAVSFLLSRTNWHGRPVPQDSWFSMGLAAGFGAMAGDSAKSFVKRRLHIAPGQPWVPADQIDFILGDCWRSPYGFPSAGSTSSAC